MTEQLLEGILNAGALGAMNVVLIVYIGRKLDRMLELLARLDGRSEDNA